MTRLLDMDEFRHAPLGWWSNLQTIPCGESVGVFPNGIAIAIWRSGFREDETYFEWQPAGNWTLRIRRLLGPGEDADDGDGDWEVIAYSVRAESQDGRVRYELVAPDLGGIIDDRGLWYEGEVGPGGPACRWPPERQPAQKPSAHSPLFRLNPHVVSAAYWGLFGLAVGGVIAWDWRSLVPVIVGVATGLAWGLLLSWNGSKPRR